MLSKLSTFFSSSHFHKSKLRLTGILRLAGKYGAERLEAACRRIEPKTASTYKRIEAILRNNLEDTPPAQSDMMPYMPKNDNVRGSSAYQ